MRQSLCTCGTCKRCKQRETAKRWRERNPGAATAAARKWREAHPEEQQAATRKWRTEHPEAVRASKRAAYQRYANQAKVRANLPEPEPEPALEVKGTNVPTCDCGTCETCRHREYMREWRKKNPEKITASKREWKKSERGRQRSRESSRRIRLADPQKVSEAARQRRLAEPQKVAARQEVRNALLRGELVKQPCRVCGNPRSQAHHQDYSKPLEVDWLCASHHAALHATVGG